MRILLTGKNGQLGFELTRTLAPLGELVAFDRSSLNLADPDRIVSAVRSTCPDVLVNAAAYTQVDRAETEPDAAHAVNASAVAILAEETKRLGALLVHYSTDYVFDGTKTSPYVEADAPNPINAYGRTKLDGERAIQASGCLHLILRTSWVYSTRGSNFLLTILRRARELPELRIVDDQVGSPTWCRDLAVATAALIEKVSPERGGEIYHLASSGATSWCGFAREILRVLASQTPVHAIPTYEYPTPAKRPLNSVLSSRSIAVRWGIELPSWDSSLARCLREANFSKSP